LNGKLVHHNPFSNLTYFHPCGSNCKHNHYLLISICQRKSEGMKLYWCQCEVLSQHRVWSCTAANVTCCHSKGCEAVLLPILGTVTAQGVKLYCCQCDVLSQHRVWSCTAANVTYCHSTAGKCPATNNNLLSHIIRVPNDTTMWCTQYQTTAAHLSAQCDHYKDCNKQHWIVSSKFCPKCDITWMQGCVFIQQTVR
jgi:hypothetical protein